MDAQKMNRSAADPRNAVRNAIKAANQWRSSQVQALIMACENEGDLAQVTEPFMIRAADPTQRGFQGRDIDHFIDVLTRRLVGYDREDGTRFFGKRESLSFKTRKLGQINERIQRAGGRVDRKVLDDREKLSEQLSDLGYQVRGLERAIVALQDIKAKRQEPHKVIVEKAAPEKVTLTVKEQPQMSDVEESVVQDSIVLRRTRKAKRHEPRQERRFKGLDSLKKAVEIKKESHLRSLKSAYGRALAQLRKVSEQDRPAALEQLKVLRREMDKVA